MKTGRRLERGHENLITDERFRLMIAAEARSDTAEIKRLVGTCPRKTYKILDPAVTDLHEDAHALAAVVAADVVAIRGRITVVDATEWAGRISFAAAADADAAEYEVLTETGMMQPAIRPAVRRQGAATARRCAGSGTR
jgi:hypothetical protein